MKINLLKKLEAYFTVVCMPRNISYYVCKHYTVYIIDMNVYEKSLTQLEIEINFSSARQMFYYYDT